MRTFIAVLVVANLLAFAWWRGWLDEWIGNGREPQRIGRQIAPGKVRVVPIERFDAARAAAAAVAAAAARAPCPEGGPCEPAPENVK